jgi:uncharacterized protein with NRDE domain
MCTIALMIDVVVGAPLVIAANRDEFYARPTRPPEVLRESPRIVGGRDVLSGGTWLAVRRAPVPRFAAVTNQRALVAQPPGLVSRGVAVIETVAAEDPAAYVHALDATKYASMNLVWGDATGASVAYARREDGTVDVLPLGRGIHVLCNDRIGAEGFPKAERLALALAPFTGAPLADVIAALPALLGDHTRVEPTLHGHLPRELARELTAACIHTEAYGTRSATIVAIGERITYLHADGPPCTTPFRDLSELV